MHRTARPFIVVAIILLLAVGSAHADGGARYTPHPVTVADQFSNVGSHMNRIPSSGTIANIQTNSIDTDEVDHACRTDGADDGSHSVWFAVGLPGGTLNIDTQGSDYNTVMSVYQAAGQFDALTPVACNDDDVPDSDTTSRISAVLPAGIYYVQISRWAPTPTGTSISLSVSVSASFDGPTPKGDNFADARPIRINKAVTVDDVQFATEEIAEPDLLCGPVRPAHSVWFRLDLSPETFGVVSLTTQGSKLQIGTNTEIDTVMEVFTGSSLPSLTPRICSNDFGANGLAVIPSHLLQASVDPTLYIRVTSVSRALTGPSRFKLKITAITLVGLLPDASFEEVPSKWTLSNPSSDGQVCGFNFSAGDDCVYQFSGGAGEKSTLKQNSALPAEILARTDHEFFFAMLVESPDPATNFTGLMKVSYADGTPATKLKIKLVGSTGPGYITSTVFTPIKSKKVGTLSYKLKNKSAAGTVRVRVISAGIVGTLARDTASNGVLPPPPPPAH